MVELGGVITAVGNAFTVSVLVEDAAAQPPDPFNE